jgi:hypothetical protein
MSAWHPIGEKSRRVRARRGRGRHGTDDGSNAVAGYTHWTYGRRRRGGDALVRGFQSMGMGGPMITTPGTLTPI